MTNNELITIYRIEDSTDWSGPYISNDHKGKDKSWISTMSRHQNNNICPSVRDDCKGFNYDYSCGFENIDQVVKWFTKQELSCLQSQDYVLGVYQLPKSGVLFGKKQVAFLRDYAVRLREIELPVTDLDYRLFKKKVERIMEPKRTIKLVKNPINNEYRPLNYTARKHLKDLNINFKAFLFTPERLKEHIAEIGKQNLIKVVDVSNEPKVKFKRKDGTPTYYNFACGHVESFEKDLDNLFKIRLEIYKEAGCNTWQIRGFKHYKGSSACDRLFWHSIDTTMKDALKKFNEEKRNINMGVYSG